MNRVLFPYVEPEDYPADERAEVLKRRGPTDAWRRKVTPELKALGWEVRPVRLTYGELNPGPYDALLRREWLEPGDLAIVEHDNTPDTTAFLEMLTCSHPLCVEDYLLNRCHYSEMISDDPSDPITTDGKMHVVVCWLHEAKHSSVRVFEGGDPWMGHWARADDQRGDLVPLGITRFRWELRKRLGPNWPPAGFLMLDTELANWIRGFGYRVHIHRPTGGHDHLIGGNHRDRANIASAEGVPDVPVVPLGDLTPKNRRDLLQRPAVQVAYAAIGKPVPEA